MMTTRTMAHEAPELMALVDWINVMTLEIEAGGEVVREVHTHVTTNGYAALLIYGRGPTAIRAWRGSHE